MVSNFSAISYSFPRTTRIKRRFKRRFDSLELESNESIEWSNDDKTNIANITEFSRLKKVKRCLPIEEKRISTQNKNETSENIPPEINRLSKEIRTPLTLLNAERKTFEINKSVKEKLATNRSCETSLLSRWKSQIFSDKKELNNSSLYRENIESTTEDNELAIDTDSESSTDSKENLSTQLTYADSIEDVDSTEDINSTEDIFSTEDEDSIDSLKTTNSSQRMSDNNSNSTFFKSQIQQEKRERIRYKKNGHIARLQQLLSRHNSDRILWQHEREIPGNVFSSDVEGIVSKIQIFYGRALIQLKLKNKNMTLVMDVDEIIRLKVKVGTTVIVCLDTDPYLLHDCDVYLSVNKIIIKNL